MKYINRQVVIIKPKKPYVDWINALPGNGEIINIDTLNNDCTALLLPHFDTNEESMKFIKKNYDTIFEIELDTWSTNPKYWPKKRNYGLFQEWFKIELHSEVVDFGESRIEIEEY